MAFIQMELKEIKRIEQAEVILTNLLMLKHRDKEEFLINFDDVVVSLEAAVGLLNQSLASRMDSSSIASSAAIITDNSFCVYSLSNSPSNPETHSANSSCAISSSIPPCVRIVVASVFHSIRQGAEVRHE